MTEARADYSTSVLLSQPQIDIQSEQILTVEDTDQAWKDQIAAVDRWIDSGYDDALQMEMDQALAYAEFIQDLYHDQCKRRVYCDDGTWYVIPKYAEARIKGYLYKVEVLQAIKSRSFWAVQVRALPIDGWQPRPFGMGAFGIDPVDTGAVPLENVRVNGQALGA